jgi:citrate/tricarballylate utilization protein
LRDTEAIAKSRRFLEICNACRYCEGYCAVFPAMELRQTFSNSEVGYLANLCHDCRGCYFACPFSPPHEFLLNLPQAFSLVRAETYEEYAWPRGLGGVFRRNGTVVGLVAAASIAVVLGLTARLQAAANLYQAADAPGAFYAVIPEWAMVGTAMLTFLFALLALSMGFVNFWRDTGAARCCSSARCGRRWATC